MNKKILLLLFILSCLSAGSNFFSFKSKTVEQTPFSFDQLKKNKATVLVFLLVDCPASQSYTLTLNQLSSRYAKDSISIVGIFPGTFSKDQELIDFKNNYKIKFPLIVDPEMKIAKQLGATIVPEAFLINSLGEIVYSGRIDDWMYALGKKRQVVRSRDLENAIQAVILNKKILIHKTDAIGCILQYD